MGDREFHDWIEYYNTEPWGAFRDNVHAGMIAALIANQGRKKGTTPLTYKDFLIQDAKKSKAEKKQQFKAQLRALATKAK